MVLPSTRQLQAFLHAARLKSFRRAANLLHISQSALSQSIAQLELVLGTTLLLRSTRSIELTEAGEFLLTHLEIMLPELHRVVSSLRDKTPPSGVRLRVGCIPSAALQFLPSTIKAFRSLQPTVAVTAIDGASDQLNQAVQQKELDLAVTSSVPSPKSGLKFQKVFTDHFRAVMRRDHVLAQQKNISWSELFRFDFLGMVFSSGIRQDIDAGLFGTRLVQRPIIELAQLYTMLGLLEQGVGVSALPSLACPPADHPILCSRPLRSPDVKREIGFVALRKVFDSEKVRVFRESMTQQIAKNREQFGRR
jgi:DNA-binding transcriptional LysR family regulator